MGFIKKLSRADILEKGSVKSYIKEQKVIRKMYEMFSDTEESKRSKMRDRILKMDEANLDIALEYLLIGDRDGFKKLVDSIKISNAHRVNLS